LPIKPLSASGLVVAVRGWAAHLVFHQPADYPRRGHAIGGEMAIIGIVNLAERLLNQTSTEGQGTQTASRQVTQASNEGQTQKLEDQFTPSRQNEGDAGLFQVAQFSFFSAAEFLRTQTAPPGTNQAALSAGQANPLAFTSLVNQLEALAEANAPLPAGNPVSTAAGGIAPTANTGNANGTNATVNLTLTNGHGQTAQIQAAPAPAEPALQAEAATA
jgi:hypothetical protein